MLNLITLLVLLASAVGCAIAAKNTGLVTKVIGPEARDHGHGYWMDDNGVVHAESEDPRPEPETVQVVPVRRRILVWFSIVSACLFALNLVLSSVYVVGGANVGAPVTFGYVHDGVDSGLHLKVPITEVNQYPKRPLLVKDAKIVVRTFQSGQFTIVYGGRWKVLTENGQTKTAARELYLQTRTGDVEKITDDFVDKQIAQAIGFLWNGYTNTEANTDREGKQRLVLAKADELLKPFGIELVNLYLRSVEPDAKTSDALARLASQQRETEIATEAQQTALKQNQVRNTQAEGISDAAGRLPKDLTPIQLQALCIQAWQDTSARAIQAGRDVYTQPCTGAGNTQTVVGAK